MWQELVDHCARQGKPEMVEAAVMHMDIASLDLNQVISKVQNLNLKSIVNTFWWQGGEPSFLACLILCARNSALRPRLLYLDLNQVQVL